MVEDEDFLDVVYNGARHDRIYNFIHEIGHVHSTVHEKAYWWLEWFEYKVTVMVGGYYGPVFTSWEFSSSLYHGNETCVNAKLIRNFKHRVANYA